MFKCSCTGILQTTIWSLCQTEGQRPPWLTMWMLPNMEFILTMQWLVKALIENKGQLGLHSLGITPLILAATSKMTNSTPSNDSHSTKYAVFLLGQQLVKHSIRNIESGIHKLEFTAYIYLTVYSGIVQRSLQKVLKVGTVTLELADTCLIDINSELLSNDRLTYQLGTTPLENNLIQFR